VLVHGA
jgi:pimeloyl-ACP methyl ester carboxylesterase